MKNTISLNGSSLTINQIIDIATKNDEGVYPHVSIDEKALKNVKICAEAIRKKAEVDKEILYGVTTGFGSKADTAIPLDHAKELQLNLLRSHAAGVGENLPVSVVRAMMLIRLNTLLQGHSGVQVRTVELLKDFINKEIHPVVPSQGSVGASGDLCPLSHLALPLIGEGKIQIGNKPTIYQGKALKEKLKEHRLKPVTLSYKEGLALNNGTTLMTALGALAVYEAKQLLKLATFTSALTFEALCARSDAYAYAPIHKVRSHKGQTTIARWLTRLLSGSTHIDLKTSDVLDNKQLFELVKQYEVEEVRKKVEKNLQEVIQAKENQQKKFTPDLYKCVPSEGEGKEWKLMLDFAEKKFKPQDSYSIRCVPQVFGAVYAAISHVEEVIKNELNASVDNPLIFLKKIHGNDVTKDRVVSGGNFHGEPLALPLDYLKLAIAEMGSIVERQINKLVDSHTNDGLPSFLVNSGGLNSGLMIPQYVAASLASENKVLVHPASADSIPTCENTEDHVSMGPIAGRQALEIMKNVKAIVAIAILTAYQATAMRKQQFEKCEITVDGKSPKLSPKMEAYCSEIKNILKPESDWLDNDRFLSPEIEKILKKIPEIYKMADRILS